MPMAMMQKMAPLGGMRSASAKVWTKDAEVERVAQMSVGAGCDDDCRRAWRVLDDQAPEIGCGPGAEECCRPERRGFRG